MISFIIFTFFLIVEAPRRFEKNLRKVSEEGPVNCTHSPQCAAYHRESWGFGSNTQFHEHASFTECPEDDKGMMKAKMYGNIHKFSYYFADLLVGAPTPQITSLIMDTGSILAAMPCKTCVECGSNHFDKNFDPEQSDTFEWLSCDSGCSCSGGFCRYYQKFVEGSMISGQIFEDYMRLGGSEMQNPYIKNQMGCHDVETNLFLEQKANGIMGLIAGKTKFKNKPSMLRNIFAAKTDYYNIFSICLSQEGGEIHVYGYATTHFTGDYSDEVWIDMSPTDQYDIQLLQIKVLIKDEEPWLGPIDSEDKETYGRCIVDSGTTYSYFPTAIYHDLIEQIDIHCAKTFCPRRKYQNCYDMTVDDLDKFPTIITVVGRKEQPHEVNWFPKSYMYPIDGGKKFCIAFGDNADEEGSVMGASWMIHHTVVFDLYWEKLGIADSNCPEYCVENRNTTIASNVPLPKNYQDHEIPLYEKEKYVAESAPE